MQRKRRGLNKSSKDSNTIRPLLFWELSPRQLDSLLDEMERCLIEGQRTLHSEEQLRLTLEKKALWMPAKYYDPKIAARIRWLRDPYKWPRRSESRPESPIPVRQQRPPRIKPKILKPSKPMIDRRFGIGLSMFKAKSLATKHVAKALQINGTQGMTMIEQYAKKAGEDTVLQRLLRKSLELAIKRWYLNPGILRSEDATKIEIRKWVAQIRRQSKWDFVVFGANSNLPLDLRRPSVHAPEFWLPVATALVEEACKMIT